MAKCTGSRCPMQVWYKVDECNHTDCPYRTEPITNADRIRAMSDEELADIICCPKGEMTYSCVLKDCVKCCLDWLKQPAKEET